MIQFHRWSDHAYEFVFEKNAFYYCHSRCMAFRESGSKTIYVKGRLFSGKLLEMVNMLSVTGKVSYMDEEQFFNAANAVYAKSVLRGVQRIGLETLFCQKNKGEKNVTDRKSDAG